MILCVESSDTSVVTDGNLMSPEVLVLKILESQIVHTRVDLMDSKDFLPN